MNILDLFSGIGGMSLGFGSANYKNYDFTKSIKKVAECSMDCNSSKGGVTK